MMCFYDHPDVHSKINYKMKGLKAMTYNLINGNDFNVNEQIETKYLIVGSGAGGAVASIYLISMTTTH